ncbi:Na+/H+ antiporter NhaA [Spongisporangium articulatum]|uniref:Na(+)/H(+) antiporter NhaA n=1 Tax=Spongisporangium articulatum TaxID=3362603 RepID=A0ABW8AJI2_9ACTN
MSTATTSLGQTVSAKATRTAAKLRRRLTPEVTSTALLLLGVIGALVWANDPWGHSYDEFWHEHVALSAGGHAIDLSLQHWVNDGLMTLFFFVIGLEVRRDLALGELTDRTRLIVPSLAALGGVLAPALVYLAVVRGGPDAGGWGAVVATDTAFLLGILALVGPSSSSGLRVFLLSLSVVDDVVALTIVAVVYSDEVSVPALALAAVAIATIVVLTHLRIWRGGAYLVVGLVMWVAMIESGVHPSVGGILLGLLVAAYSPRPQDVDRAAALARAFRQSPLPGLARLTKLSVERAVSTNERLQELLRPWTALVIVPVFALANAGVGLDGAALRAAVHSPVMWGVVAGLVLGKPLGIGLTTSLGARLRPETIPPGVSMLQLWGGAALGGIGFTVSLFVIDLAFDGSEAADDAKIGVLAAVLASTVMSWALFRLSAWRHPEQDGARPIILDLPVDPSRDHIRGPVDALVTLVEYGDFECPFCGRATGTVAEVRARFGDRLRYVFRHLPLSDVHPNAQLAAEAAEAAGAQGAFWEMHDRLFEHQGQLTAGDLVQHAAALGLDVPRFARELGSGVYAERVAQDRASAAASGADGTPTFFVGDRRVVGQYDAETLTNLLHEAKMAAGYRMPARPPHADVDDALWETSQLTPGTRSRSWRPLTRADMDEPIAETPDLLGSYPRLDAEQLRILERYGARRRAEAAEVLAHIGEAGYALFVVLSGMAIVVGGDKNDHRLVSAHGPGRFLGELSLLTGEPPVLALKMHDPGEVLVVPRDRLPQLFADHPDLAALINRAMLLRRGLLLGVEGEEPAAEPVTR